MREQTAAVHRFSDYYKILGVLPNADKARIALAFAEKVEENERQATDGQQKNAMEALLTRAFDTLIDDGARHSYDEYLCGKIDNYVSLPKLEALYAQTVQTLLIYTLIVVSIHLAGLGGLIPGLVDRLLHRRHDLLAIGGALYVSALAAQAYLIKKSRPNERNILHLCTFGAYILINHTLYLLLNWNHIAFRMKTMIYEPLVRYSGGIVYFLLQASLLLVAAFFLFRCAQTLRAWQTIYSFEKAHSRLVGYVAVIAAIVLVSLLLA